MFNSSLKSITAKTVKITPKSLHLGGTHTHTYIYIYIYIYSEQGILGSGKRIFQYMSLKFMYDSIILSPRVKTAMATSRCLSLLCLCNQVF